MNNISRIKRKKRKLQRKESRNHTLYDASILRSESKKRSKRNRKRNPFSGFRVSAETTCL